MIIFTCHATTHMVGAGDTWVALACGRHFINHGVDTIEPFSANSHKSGPTQEDINAWPKLAQRITDKVSLDTVKFWHPTGWINQNWLTHVIFYWLTHISPFADADSLSFNSLAYWKLTIYLLTAICIYYTGRILNLTQILSAAFVCFAMFIARSFLDIRPAGFSNMLASVLLLVLVLTTYKNILYIWLIVPLTIFWCNVHGGYILAFIMLVPFISLNFLTIPFKNTFTSIGKKGLCHTITATFAAFAGMIIFNPFHLTNLTHTFTISISKHAQMWRTVNEWHPAFEWDNPVGDEIPFLIMYIIAWIVSLSWLIIMPLTARFIKHHFKHNRKRHTNHSNNYQPPKINLALIAIAAITIYMAIRSRRFIPIAAFTACPILAMFTGQIINALCIGRNLRKHNHLIINPISGKHRLICTIASLITVLFFGIWWGTKFKHIYLDPWPNETKLNSVFMRMTASDVKPFKACQFIKDNKLEGKMFNYWTEGGFIAWGQQPNPNNGLTPLQLFIDGRAQAAYQPKYYKLWARIMSGGPTVGDAISKKQKLNKSHYRKIGKWIDEQLKIHEIWVVLLPANQWNNPFTRGLEHNPDWQLAYFDNKQKLYVNMTTHRGKKLLEGIFNGQTLYPDKFTKYLVTAHNMNLFSDDMNTKKRALDFAFKAFMLNPSQAPMLQILLADKFDELRPYVVQFCTTYIEDITKNKKQYSNQDGYHHKNIAALVAGNYLHKHYKNQNNPKLTQYYSSKIRDFTKEKDNIRKEKRW